MRDRHWKELRIEVKEDFDEKSEDFTLEKVFSFNLLQHSDKIEEICSHARQQLKIEKSLDNIKYLWEESPTTNLEIETSHTKGSNDVCYRLTTTENIIALIEEHSGELAKHKSSNFYKQFAESIDAWENNIAKITDTLEILITVQDRWQYLESIFGGQQHIQKQLAQEYSIFKQVDGTFRNEMFRIYKERNAYKALVEEAIGFIEELNKLNKSLEIVQKKLNDLLASKRCLFPRFFFLSNEDLLEIIGQAKNPVAINKHIKKIYEGIDRIETDSVNQSKGQKDHVITHVVAEDGERLGVQDSQSKVLELTTEVQSWMSDLTNQSKQALEREFSLYAQNAPATQGRRLPDKDKLTTNINQNIGQILLTWNQIEWTKCVKDALM